MSTQINIHYPEIEVADKGSDTYVYLADNITIFFKDTEEALSFFEQGRDMVLEKGGDDEDE